jgi:hypothetical protein
MAFRADIFKLVSTAFDIIDDLKEKVDIRYLVTLGAYDPAADAESAVFNNLPNIGVVFTRFSLEEVNASVDVKTDMKILMDASRLNFVPPKATDVILEVAAGIKWNVQGYKTVPGNSLFIVHVRRSG